MFSDQRALSLATIPGRKVKSGLSRQSSKSLHNKHETPLLCQHCISRCIFPTGYRRFVGHIQQGDSYPFHSPSTIWQRIKGFAGERPILRVLSAFWDACIICWSSLLLALFPGCTQFRIFEHLLCMISIGRTSHSRFASISHPSPRSNIKRRTMRWHEHESHHNHYT